MVLNKNKATYLEYIAFNGNSYFAFLIIFYRIDAAFNCFSLVMWQVTFPGYDYTVNTISFIFNTNK